MAHNFKIGEKVVCIDSGSGYIFKGNNKGRINTNQSIKGRIYTIYGLSPDTNNLILEEIKFNSFGNLSAHNYKRFRKLDYEFAEQLLESIKESVLIKQ
jgi:hypothetical protein